MYVRKCLHLNNCTSGLYLVFIDVVAMLIVLLVNKKFWYLW